MILNKDYVIEGVIVKKGSEIKFKEEDTNEEITNHEEYLEWLYGVARGIPSREMVFQKALKQLSNLSLNEQKNVMEFLKIDSNLDSFKKFLSNLQKRLRKGKGKERDEILRKSGERKMMLSILSQVAKHSR